LCYETKKSDIEVTYFTLFNHVRCKFFCSGRKKSAVNQIWGASTFSITTLSITTFSIKGLFVTPTVNAIQQGQYTGIQWNAIFMKCYFDEMPFWWNSILMKCHFDEIPFWWNVILMKCHFNEMPF
jgi:hypothetical protein